MTKLYQTDFCLDEWATGVHIKADFREKDVIARHAQFHVDLKEWEELNPSTVEGIRKKFYNRAMYVHVTQTWTDINLYAWLSRDAGISDDDKPKPSLNTEDLERVRNELEGHTGETDSENDIE